MSFKRLAQKETQLFMKAKIEVASGKGTKDKI